MLKIKGITRMREILFRAKAINRDKGEHRTKYKNGDWVYGLISRPYKDMFPTLPMEMRNTRGIDGIEVDYKTLGQFTGVTDKNGKKIFEGDVLHIKAGHGDCVVGKAIVYFDEKVLQFRVRELKPYAYDSEVGDMYRECDFAHIDLYKVIGNIHDNPELLKELQNG